ncbi:MAG: cyclic nucleotide-binding domain-containing protein [Deltaproteobacteria bacterium]|nr:cyclic nucleotide-binding domain-containing protein [Deltaproteobacteria bacterium]
MNNIDKARELKDKGAHLLEKGKTDAALKEFQKAVELTPDDIAARKKVAELLVKLGRKDAAVAEYQHLAGRYATDGQLAQAIAVSKLILQLDPSHTQTQETLARLYSRKTGGSSWLEKIPPSMAGALNLKHVTAPQAQPAPLVSAAQVAVEPSSLELEIDTSELPRAPLFSELPREIFLALLNEVAMRSVAPGATIVREGEPGHSMYVLAQGNVQVVRSLGRDQKIVAEMGEGTFFGEIGLLSDVPRLASVVAANECVVLEVTREMLGNLTARHPALEPVLQHFYRDRLLANLLRSNPLFTGFDDEARRALVDRFALKKVGQGAALVKEGEPGNALFVLLRGRCDVFHSDAQGAEHAYPSMSEGAIFGEIALLREGLASATVRAAEGCLLLALDRAAFRDYVLANEQARKALEKLRDERLQRTVEMLVKLGPEYAAWV